MSYLPENPKIAGRLCDDVETCHALGRKVLHVEPGKDMIQNIPMTLEIAFCSYLGEDAASLTV